jgi:hypothetical protein
MSGRSGRTAGLGMLVGGAVFIVSNFLTWFTFKSAGGEQEIKGIGNEGAGSLVMAIGGSAFAVVVLILGLILAIRGRGRGLAIAGLVLALFPLIVGAYVSFAPEGAIVTFESKQAGENLGISESEAKAALQNAFDSGELEATAGVGAYVALAGAAIAFIASIAGIVTGGRKPEALIAPPAPGAAFPPAASPPPPPAAPPAP